MTSSPPKLAQALHAEHDVGWRPGASEPRLAELAEMAAAAHACGDADLEAEAVLLQAAALIERGDPEGLERLDHYVRLADRLGTAVGRWGAISRRATLAQMTGRVEEAATLAEQARETQLSTEPQLAAYHYLPPPALGPPPPRRSRRLAGSRKPAPQRWLPAGGVTGDDVASCTFPAPDRKHRRTPVPHHPPRPPPARMTTAERHPCVTNAGIDGCS